MATTTERPSAKDLQEQKAARVANEQAELAAARDRAAEEAADAAAAVPTTNGNGNGSHVDAQDGLFDTVIENDSLEKALEEREGMREERSAVNLKWKETTDKIKGIVATLDVDDGATIRAAKLFASTEADSVSFVCAGKPQPAGSKTAFRDPRTGRVIVKDDNPKSKPWKKAVGKAALPAMTGRPLLDGPLSILVVFFLDRPKGHFGTGRNAERVKDIAPARPIVRPDVLKLARAVEDALTGVVYEDDAQIVREHLEKHYGSPARVVVEITPIED